MLNANSDFYLIFTGSGKQSVDYSLSNPCDTQTQRLSSLAERVNDDNFIKRLRQVSEDTGTAVYTWALLNNHAHIPMRSGPVDRSLIRSIIDRIDPVKTFWYRLQGIRQPSDPQVFLQERVRT
jgi:hypothetical protein